MNQPGPPNQPAGPFRPMGHPGPPPHPIRGATPPHPPARPTPVRKRGGRTKLVIAAAVAATAVGVTGGAAWSFFGTQSGAEVQPAASQVFLESVGTAGAQPFMAPVGQDRAGISQPAGTAGSFAGDTPGLFAENPDQPSCDAQGLLSNLQADPTKAGAWAQALAIKTEDIPGFIETLKPVVLRADTAVTSHGYDNGAFTAYPAVLQAGTAVLVNSYGEPTVKCYSGNPLTRAIDYAQASYVGPSWSYFAPTAVTYVDPTPTVITNYTYVDVDHGGFHHRPSWCSEHPNSHNCHHNPNPKPGPDPGPKPTPDPKLEEAAKKAAQTAKEAGEAFSKADQNARQFETNQRNADADATALEKIAADKAALLAKDPDNPALKQSAAEADATAKQARQNAQTAAAQAQFQRKAADAIKKNKEVADEAAKKAQDEADNAAGRKPAAQKDENQAENKAEVVGNGQDGNKDKNLVDDQVGKTDAKDTADPAENKGDVAAENKGDVAAENKGDVAAGNNAETPADKKAETLTGDRAGRDTTRTGGVLNAKEKVANGTADAATTAKKSADVNSADARRKAQATPRAADAVTKSQQARHSDPLPESKVIKRVLPEQKQAPVQRERQETPAQSGHRNAPTQQGSTGASDDRGHSGDGASDSGGE